MAAKVLVWDLPVRVFHWVLAGSFAVAYTVAESESLRQIHVVLGYTATALILFRILWGFVGSHFARFESFTFSPFAAARYLNSLATKNPQHYLGHTPAGSYAIYAILILGLATGITGYMTLHEVGGESAEDLHEVLANVWLFIVIVHIAGVIVGSWVHRENLVRAMVSGYKQSIHSEQGASGPAPATRLVGVALAAAVGAFWVWAQLTGSLVSNERRGMHGSERQGAQTPERAEDEDRQNNGNNGNDADGHPR